MTKTAALLTLAIYLILGIACLLMAFKTFSASKFLPFHEKAAGKEWETIDKPLQSVIITLLRISGLGFFTLFVFLVLFPALNYFKPVSGLEFMIPAVPFVFCSGLFIFNYNLSKKTKVQTPWKGALAAMFLIVIAFFLSLPG